MEPRVDRRRQTGRAGGDRTAQVAIAMLVAGGNHPAVDAPGRPAAPTGWAMDGLHRLISYGDGPASVIPHVAALAIASVAVSWVAVRRLRFVDQVS